jgi:hypothetical protein
VELVEFRQGDYRALPYPILVCIVVVPSPRFGEVIGMSDAPENWNEIKADKGFWDLVLAFKEASSDWAEVDLEDDAGEEHRMALDFVKYEADPVFTLYFMSFYGEPTSSSVKEVAGKFYVADWADPPYIDGPYATIEEAARGIIVCGNGDTFTGASSCLPDDRMLVLCEEAVGSNVEFEVDGVMHVMTASGLEPKV